MSEVSNNYTDMVNYFKGVSDACKGTDSFGDGDFIEMVAESRSGKINESCLWLHTPDFEVVNTPEKRIIHGHAGLLVFVKPGKKYDKQAIRAKTYYILDQVSKYVLADGRKRKLYKSAELTSDISPIDSMLAPGYIGWAVTMKLTLNDTTCVDDAFWQVDGGVVVTPVGPAHPLLSIFDVSLIDANEENPLSDLATGSSYKHVRNGIETLPVVIQHDGERVFELGEDDKERVLDIDFADNNFNPYQTFSLFFRAYRKANNTLSALVSIYS